MKKNIEFSAHRGGLDLFAENTLPAFKRSFDLGWTPEIDIRATKDGELICFHDEVLNRMLPYATNLHNRPISEINYEEIASMKVQGSDCGCYELPHLKKVFNLLSKNQERQVILDIKDVPETEAFTKLFSLFPVEDQVIFTTCTIEECEKYKTAFPKALTQIWIHKEAHEIEEIFTSALNNPLIDGILLVLNQQGKDTFHIPFCVIEKCFLRSRKKRLSLALYSPFFTKKEFEILTKIGYYRFSRDNISS